MILKQRESEFDLTETGAMDFDFEDEEESEFGKEKDMGNTSQIKFRAGKKRCDRKR